MTDARIDEVKPDGVGPVYDQIRRAIRDLVVSGNWRPGTPVPPEHALMERLGASRMTVHRALVELARDGLITRRRRSGTVVAEPATSHAMFDILSIPDEVRRLGKAYSYEVLHRRDGRAVESVRKRFALARNETTVHLQVLHRADATPHVLEERVIHLAAVPQAAEEAFAGMPPGDWLLAHSRWSQAEHAISATPAGSEVAGILQVEAGTACLLVERRTWDQDAPVTAVRLLYPGSGHRFVGRFSPYGVV